MKKAFSIILIAMSISANLIAANNSAPPNIIVIFCDDLGYADLSCYGSVWNQTPDIDRMAVEGLRFTDFYAGAPVCTPSRAGLMTGCYARRVDMDLDADNRWVLFAGARKGINPQEILLPEALKEAGYSSAIIGKWHLGDQPEFLPVRHGFDYWVGLPYSNDMGIRKGEQRLLPLMRNETVIDQLEQRKEADQASLTKRYTEEAIHWMGENREQPFFLYLAHTMPHNPVAARQQYYLRTVNPKQGFGASIAEISWSTGEILDYLRKEGIAGNTLVIFTSDNGGAPHWGASNGILKGHKGQTFEGGVRVPCIAWWPGKIDPGTTCNAPASVLDFYSTFTALADIKPDDKVKRDGIDISDYFFNPGMERKPRPYFYWHVGYLQAVRYGNWKVNLLGGYTEEEQLDIMNSTYRSTLFSDQIELYNLREDPGETNDVSEKYPEIVALIMKLAEEEKRALGEYTRKGPEVRKTISNESPVTLIK
jgi:arylsulfatase A-like enzyme